MNKFRLSIFILSMIFSWNAFSQETPAKKTPEQLLEDQKRISENYQRFDEVLLRMADIMSVTDPDRAALLTRVITQSREKMIRLRFDSVVKLLDEKTLSKALDNQKELTDDLKFLLALLESEDRIKKVRSEMDRLREDLKAINDLIREERSLQNRTENAADIQKLAEVQRELAEKTKKLAGKMEREAQDENSPLNPGKNKENKQDGEGENKPDGENGENPDKPSENQNSPSGKPCDCPPGESCPSCQPGENQQDQQNQPNTPQQKLREAQRRMQEAQKKLEEAERKGAVDEQERAIQELEKAKAELEEILRQMREEEAKRYLTLLEARLKKMLQLQRTVYEDTVRLGKTPAEERTHDHRMDAERLGRRESDIVLEADKTLLLLREDGSAVALPTVLAQARDDMRRVTDMLGKADVGVLTQSIEADILAALEEMIAAVEKAIKDLEDEQKKQQQQQSMADGDPALIDLLTEVKMIRSMQLRVNNRTERIGKMITGEHTETPELVEMLKDMAKQQENIRAITRDLGSGKNR